MQTLLPVADCTRVSTSHESTAKRGPINHLLNKPDVTTITEEKHGRQMRKSLGNALQQRISQTLGEAVIQVRTHYLLI
jgi:hypothetical protein